MFHSSFAGIIVPRRWPNLLRLRALVVRSSVKIASVCAACATCFGVARKTAWKDPARCSQQLQLLVPLRGVNELPAVPADSSWRLRASTILAAGAVSALFGALPAILRAGASGVRWLALVPAWAALATCAMVPALALVLAYRTLAHELRLQPLPMRVICTFFALCFAFHALLGAALRIATHHHALAGVLFGVLALPMLAISALAARRLGYALRGESLKRAADTFAALALAVLVLLAAFRVSRGELPVATRMLLVDAVALLLGTAATARLTVVPMTRRSRRVIALIGAPFACAVLGAGLVALALGALPTGHEAFAPGHALIVQWFHRR
jgi:hypothetical protein